MCQYSKKLQFAVLHAGKETLKWVQLYLKDRTYPLCATESEKRLIRKRSTDFSLSHDDVLLYVGGNNENARVLLLTEEDSAFGVSRVQKWRLSGKRPHRRQIEALLLAAHASGHTSLGKCMHACIHIPSILTHTSHALYICTLCMYMHY